MTKPKKGFAIHCHHDILAEHCYNYQERVDYIKKEKPKEEVKTRLRLFKILPKEALKDIPVYYLKADAEWVKAYAEWVKARAEWTQKQKDAFHQKWCGCSEWDGKKITFAK